jgi:hypothetical protein
METRASSPSSEAAIGLEARAADTRATPPFYLAEGRGGARLFLLGTLHVGPPQGWPYSDAILEAVAEADLFVLEIDLRSATEEAVSTQLANRVVLDHTTSIDDLISPETKRLLEENEPLLAKLGMGPRSRHWMKPWFVAMGLIEWISNQSGYSTQSSVEAFVLDALAARPLVGLETLDEQMALFDDLPPPLQDVMLRDTLAHLDEANENVEALVAAWRVGDEGRLSQIARAGVEEMPELDAFYDRLLGDRNRRWLETLGPLLEDTERANESIFVGVGALHLVGDDGLVTMLREAGYRVERVAQEVSP